VWPGSGIVGRCGREQAAALIAMYGPRISVALAVSAAHSATGKARCVEMTFTSSCSTPDRWDWTISRPQLLIAHQAKTFAPGNLRACADNASYQSLVRFWMDSKFTLRYSGGLVPDVYHILIKGEGVMSNASSIRAPAKLRLAFEAAPIAFIIEHSGGLSCMHSHENDAESGLSLLDTKISTLNRRVGVCYGSSIEVKRFMKNVCSRPNSASKL
jgi:sedoheptulose-bisphosphatase